jgi:hypothetical protein
VGSIEGGATGSPARWLWKGEEPGCLFARGTFRRFDLAARRHQGPPANRRARPAAGPLPAPHLRRLASAPLVGPGCTRDSPDDTPCQEQSENIAWHPLPSSLLPSSSPSFVITGLVPGIPMDRSAVPHLIGMAGTRPAMTGRVSDRAVIPIVSLALILTSRCKRRLEGGVQGSPDPPSRRRLTAAPQDEADGSGSGMAGTDPRIESGNGHGVGERHGNQPVSVQGERQRRGRSPSAAPRAGVEPIPSAERRKRHGALLPACNEKAPA